MLARIRTIKPEFWTDGSMIRLPVEVRLFYIGLWNFACDRGPLEDDPLGLKLKVLPADQVDSDWIVQQLVDAGRLERVSVDGKPFLTIPRFADHQRVDTRWRSRCLVCSQENSDELTETHASSDETRGIGEEIPRRRGGEGKGKEGMGGESTPPRRTCGKHDGWEHGEACGACMRDRKAAETFEAEQARVRAAEKREAERNPTCPHGMPRWEACDKCGDAWPGRSG